MRTSTKLILLGCAALALTGCGGGGQGAAEAGAPVPMPPARNGEQPIGAANMGHNAIKDAKKNVPVPPGHYKRHCDAKRIW